MVSLCQICFIIDCGHSLFWNIKSIIFLPVIFVPDKRTAFFAMIQPCNCGYPERLLFWLWQAFQRWCMYPDFRPYPAFLVLPIYSVHPLLCLQWMLNISPYPLKFQCQKSHLLYVKHNPVYPSGAYAGINKSYASVIGSGNIKFFRISSDGKIPKRALDWISFCKLDSSESGNH